MTWSSLKQQIKLLLLHQVCTFPECSILLNILLIWLHYFIDLTEYRKGMKFKALGWLDMAPQVGFQVTFTALTEPAWDTKALVWVGILGTHFTSIYWVFHQNTACLQASQVRFPWGGWNDGIAQYIGRDIQFRPLSKNRQQWLLIDWVEHKRDMQICERFVALLCLDPIQRTLERTLSHTERERVGEETPCKWKVKRWGLSWEEMFPFPLTYFSSLHFLTFLLSQKNVDFSFP